MLSRQENAVRILTRRERGSQTVGSQHVLQLLVERKVYWMKWQSQKQVEEDEERIISDEHWYLDLPELQAKENLIIEVESFVPCEDLIFGRLSFGGLNPEVEKLMLLLNPRDENKAEKEEETSKMQTDGKWEVRMFAKKRERASMDEDANQNSVEKKTKRSFLKPQD